MAPQMDSVVSEDCTTFDNKDLEMDLAQEFSLNQSKQSQSQRCLFDKQIRDKNMRVDG